MEVQQYPLLPGIRLPRLGSHDDDKTQETSGSYGETAYLPPDTIINQQQSITERTVKVVQEKPIASSSLETNGELNINTTLKQFIGTINKYSE